MFTLRLVCRADHVTEAFKDFYSKVWGKRSTQTSTYYSVQLNIRFQVTWVDSTQQVTSLTVLLLIGPGRPGSHSALHVYLTRRCWGFRGRSSWGRRDGSITLQDHPAGRQTDGQSETDRQLDGRTDQVYSTCRKAFKEDLISLQSLWSFLHFASFGINHGTFYVCMDQTRLMENNRLMNWHYSCISQHQMVKTRGRWINTGSIP